MKWWIAGGAFIGAIPASAGEILEPYWGLAAVTAFLMPMLACGLLGFLIAMIIESRRIDRMDRR
jgi:hypothetical protein